MWVSRLSLFCVPTVRTVTTLVADIQALLAAPGTFDVHPATELEDPVVLADRTNDPLQLHQYSTPWVAAHLVQASFRFRLAAS